MKKQAVLLLLILPFVYSQYFNPDIGQNIIVCNEGGMQCDGNVLLRCANNNWEYEQCEYGCDPFQGCMVPANIVPQVQEEEQSSVTQVIVCTYDQKRCDGQNFQMCINNTWETQQTCSKNQACTEKGCITKAEVVSISPVLKKACMKCPDVLATSVTIPSAPYDEKVGDCALIGKSKEVNEYLKALEGAADGCKARISDILKKADGVKTDIDKRLDALPVGTIEKPNMSCLKGEFGEMVVMSSCPAKPSKPSETKTSGTPPKDKYYTDWLKRLGEDTLRYCKLVDDLFEPILEGCNDIKRELETCVPISPETAPKYKKFMNDQLEQSKKKIEYLDFFYVKTLKEYGIKRFRGIYKESLIDCPGLAKVGAKIPEVKPGIEQVSMPKEKPKGIFGKFVHFLKGFFGFGKKPLTCREECEKSYDDCVKEANKLLSIPDRTNAKLMCNKVYSACLDSCEEKEAELGKLQEPVAETPVVAEKPKINSKNISPGVSEKVVVPTSVESMPKITCQDVCKKSLKECLADADRRWPFSITDRMREKEDCHDVSDSCLEACEELPSEAMPSG